MSSVHIDSPSANPTIPHFAPGEPVTCIASADACIDLSQVVWSDNVGGTFPGGNTGAQVTYNPPDGVYDTDGKGNKVAKQIQLTCTPAGTLCPHDIPNAATTYIYVNRDPKHNCNCYCACLIDNQSESDPNKCGCNCSDAESGGMSDTKQPCDWVPCDEEEAEYYCRHSCGDDESKNEEKQCKCCCDNDPPPSGNTSYPPSGDGQDSSDEDCTYAKMAGFSRVSRSLYGRLKVKTGCGKLPVRGRRSVDFGLYFLSISDGLVNDELVAGNRRTFAWQVRLVYDANKNATIYWGDGTTETWITGNGGLSYTNPPGRFGTLFRNSVDGSYTRVKNSGIYYDFDPSGFIKRIHDRSIDGNYVYYNYDAFSKVKSISGPGMGMNAYFTYDATNTVITKLTLQAPNPAQNRVTYYNYQAGTAPQPMTSIIGPAGCTTYFAYDANKNLIQETNSDNYTAYFSWTTHLVPRIKTIDLPENQHLKFDYNDTVKASNGGPLSVVQQVGGRTDYFQYPNGSRSGKSTSIPGTLSATFAYDFNGKTTIAMGPDGATTYYEWDAFAHLKSVKWADGSMNYFTYASNNRKSSVQDELGKTTYYNFDAQGYQINWIDALGKATYFTRDNFGNLVSKKDRQGNLTYYTYDSRGNHTSTKWADRSVRYYDYNAAGNLELIVDELKSASYYDYDLRGRVTKWKDALNQVTQYGYNNRSNKTVEIDRRGFAWYWQYDGLARKIAQRTALGNTTYFNYNTLNLLTNTIDPRGKKTIYTYTDYKQKLAVTNPLNQTTYFTYYPGGEINTVKDARGFVTTLFYDIRGRLTSTQDPRGFLTVRTLDRTGRQIAYTDQRGNTTYFYFDANHRQTAKRNALNQLNYFYYDNVGNLTAQEDALQRRSYFYYDSRNRQYCVEDAGKNRTYYTYDPRNFKDSQKDARSSVTYFYPDSLLRKFAVRDARNNVQYFGYDSEGNITSTKTPRGFTTYYAFDADRRQTTTLTPLGEASYFRYDASANRISTVDPRGNPSYFYIDDLNRTFCAEDAKRARTYYTFDALGNQTSTQDPLARVTYFGYDSRNQRISSRNPAGGLQYFTYDPASNLDSVKDERSNVSYVYYDKLNRAFGRRNPLNALTYFTYNAVGTQSSVQDPVGRFNYFYFDSLNRLSAVEDGLRFLSYYSYDAVGNRVAIRNPRRATVSPPEVGMQYFTYDALNHTNSFKDEVGQTWYYDYDPDSNLFVQRNPLGALTYWTYDADGRRQSQKNPLGRTWYWTYDPAANASSMRDGLSQTTYYQYDVVNLQTRIDYPDATHHYFEYDSARQQIAFADPSGRTTVGYDPLGRMIVRSNPGSQNLYFRYDAVGNRTSFVDPDNVPTYYVYDNANRITNLQAPTYGGAITYYEYTLADELVTERRRNGTVTYYRYDKAGRLSLLDHEKTGLVIIEKYTYTRDEAGNILQVVRGSDSMSTYFSYDPANRVIKEAWRTSGGVNVYGFAYSYDAAGNRLTKQQLVGSATTFYWQYDLADQVTQQRLGSVVGVYFSYDMNGNVSIEHDTNASAGRTYYAYDPRNLLTLVDFPGATATNYFTYNAPGERIRKDDSTSQKKYIWDGLMPAMEKNLSNTTLQRMLKGYTPIAGIGEYALQDLGGTVIYPHKNQVGTTQRHTDTTGAVKNYYEYDAWGQPFVAQEATAQQYRYTGKELDPNFVDFNVANRRYHFPLRFYVPFRGSFGQRDPLLLSRDPYEMQAALRTTYDYTGGDPTSFVDPMGTEAWCITGGFTMMAGVIFSISIKFCWDDCYNAALAYQYTRRDKAKFPNKLPTEGIGFGVGAGFSLGVDWAPDLLNKLVNGKQGMASGTCVSQLMGAGGEMNVSLGPVEFGAGGSNQSDGTVVPVLHGGIGYVPKGPLPVSANMQGTMTKPIIEACMNKECPCCFHWYDVCSWYFWDPIHRGHCYQTGAGIACAFSLFKAMVNGLVPGTFK